jgi:hypothetical protein
MTRASRPIPRPGWLDRAIGRIAPNVLPAAADAPCVHALGDGVWFHERELAPGPHGPRLPTRMGIVRLSDGSLWIWSPLPPTPALLDALATLGPVRSVLAPSTLHHLWAAEFVAAVAAPELWAAPGVAAKNATLRAAPVLHDDAKPSWADELAWVNLGPLGGFVEVLCYHHATRTLFIADLGFHLDGMSRRLDRWYWSLYGSYGRLAPAFIMRMFLRRDRAAVRRALRIAAEWPFERIFVAHGAPVVDAAAARFRSALGPWLA